MKTELKYQEFLKHLNKFESDGWIVKLHRGFDKEFAFQRLKLDTKFNTIDQFAARLFFFGEKSKHLWEERFEKEISINDTSNETFEIIFDQINKLDTDNYPNDFIERNKKVFEYFKTTENKTEFINCVSELSNDKKKEARKHYLTILHQLDKNEYKGQSLYLSGSESAIEAQSFASGKDSIIINFWDQTQEFNSLKEIELQTFEGSPFPDEREVSVFGAIFPHFIYSFVFNGEVYPNPAIDTESNFDISVLSGFTIEQDDFNFRMKSETSYKRMIQKNGSDYTIN